MRERDTALLVYYGFIGALLGILAALFYWPASGSTVVVTDQYPPAHSAPSR